jgi:hypothetical protein
LFERDDEEGVGRPAARFLDVENPARRKHAAGLIAMETETKKETHDVGRQRLAEPRQLSATPLRARNSG